MKNLIETTTGALANQMTLYHCGNFAGKFQDSAFEIFENYNEVPMTFEGNEWADIMYDKEGNVYAVWSEDVLTCQNAWLNYIQLDEEDCPKAFSEMKNNFDY